MFPGTLEHTRWSYIDLWNMRSMVLSLFIVPYNFYDVILQKPLDYLKNTQLIVSTRPDQLGQNTL